MVGWIDIINVDNYDDYIHIVLWCTTSMTERDIDAIKKNQQSVPQCTRQQQRPLPGPTSSAPTIEPSGLLLEGSQANTSPADT